jgi:hypothetical protein
MPSGEARSRSDAVDPVLVLLLAGIGGYLGLHFFEPSLPITWS